MCMPAASRPHSNYYYLNKWLLEFPSFRLDLCFLLAEVTEPPPLPIPKAERHRVALVSRSALNKNFVASARALATGALKAE